MGVEEYFKLKQRRTNVKTEVIAGATTFMTMLYIVIVNPAILSIAGMPFGPVMVGTIMAAAIACIACGLYSNRPFAMAPYMGENAFFVFTMVIAFGFVWQQALAGIFIAGIIFMIFTLSGLRTKLIAAIPPFLSVTWAAAIGLFIMFIGFASAGISLPGIPGAPVTVGNFATVEILLVILGTGVIGYLLVRKIKGALLIGVIVTLIAGLGLGLAGFGTALPREIPSIIGAFPDWGEVFLKFDFTDIVSTSMISLIVVVFLMDFLDTMGGVIGLSAKAGFLDKKGRLPGIKKVMLVDAVATTFGSIFGTSTTGVYLESAAGIETGGRTGLTAVTTGILFLAVILVTPFFAGLFGIAPGFLQLAVAPALIIIGVLMMAPLKMVNFDDYTEALPAVLTIAMIIFTFNIGFGLAAGIVIYPLVKVAAGRGKEVNPWAWALFVVGVLLFVSYFHPWV